MTVTVTSIDQGPFTATGLAQTVAYTFMTLTDEEISVFYDAGVGRVLIDPASHVVTRNKNVDGSAKEGGSVELSASAAPVGSSIYLRANPRDDRDLVWSDTGSRLKNLNEEQDRVTIRQLVLSEMLARAVLVSPGADVPSPQDVIDAAKAVENKADKVFAVGSRVPAPLVSRFANVIDLSADYSVIADGATANQQTKINQAITDSLAASQPLRLRLPPGQIRIDAALSPITKSIVLEGDTERATQLRPVGSFDALTIGGGLSRVSNAGLRNVGFNAADMTGGHCVVLDWTQDAILDNVLLADPWNGISIRQSGNVLVQNVRGDGVRGSYGTKAIGPGGTRNGETDKIDVLIFLNCLMQGKYVPGDAAPTSRMIEIDGWVHTIGFWNTRLLSALSGLRTLNTYGLAQKFSPSIIRGWVEAENTYERGIHLLQANDVTLNTFSATSVTESGIEVGATARDVALFPRSENHWKFGVYVAPGAKNVALHDPVIERNNQANAGLSGVEDGSGALRVYGGRIGGGVSETQTYGLKGVTGTKAFDVDLSGNVTAPTNGDIQAIRCLPNGAGRQPSVVVTVDASPFTYTVGPRNVSVALYGGSGVAATIDGVFQVKSSPGNFLAPAGSQVIVSYATVPDMAVTPL